MYNFDQQKCLRIIGDSDNRDILFVTSSAQMAEYEGKAIVDKYNEINGERLVHKGRNRYVWEEDGEVLKSVYFIGVSGVLGGMMFDYIYISTPIRDPDRKSELDGFDHWLKNTCRLKLRNPEERVILIDNFYFK